MPAEEAVDTTTPTPQTDSRGEASSCLIFAGGALHPSPGLRADHSWDLVIAADSGYDHALRCGIAVDLLIGDLDSVSSEGLQHAERGTAAVERHRPDKDETDLELAIRAAIDRGADSITIVGGEDGRLSHLLAVATGLADERWSAIPIEWHTRTGIARVATPQQPATIDGAKGDTVSLVPVGTATGVSTSGLRWRLADDHLPIGTPRGLSNEMVDTRATVNVGTGAVIVIQEGTIE